MVAEERQELSRVNCPEDAEQGSPRAGWGWYLYGITTTKYPEAAGLAHGIGLDGRAPLQVFTRGEVAGVVSRVPLAEFGIEAVRVHGDDPAWLEAAVRAHERVVAEIHRLGTVVPAKFGCVYASIEDLLEALESRQEALLERLGGLDGCDEWGIRLYADRKCVAATAAKGHPAVRDLADELRTASPGRAFFLRRKLADSLAAATEQSLSDLAQAGYDHLAELAVAAQLGDRSGSPSASEEPEILRAAFLIRRTSGEAFVEEVRGFVAGHEGVRCEYSGPWPPYSFVTLGEEIR